MNRSEAIQRIVWCLLRYASRPDVAVATAATLREYLGEGFERQMTFTNLLRAAGLFVKDDDGYFIRYQRSDVAPDMTFLEMPDANYLLTVPVPVEPRMRIAYSVFTGLLLKYLYKTYGAVPTEVSEGRACLVAGQALPDSNALWEGFKRSDLATRAVCEGLEATLGAIGNIGGIDVTETMANSAPLPAFLTMLPRFESKFQTQGGMRLNFYLVEDIEMWLEKNHSTGVADETLEDLWLRSWQEDSSPHEVAGQIAARIVRDIQRDQPLPARTFKSLWVGEGSGANRKRGVRDILLGLKKDNNQTVRQVDELVMGFLSQLDARRKDTCTLHWWVRSKLNQKHYSAQLNQVIERIKKVLNSSDRDSPDCWSTEDLLNNILIEFRSEAIVPAMRKKVAGHDREVKSAIYETVRLCIAFQIARELPSNAPISIFGWHAATLQTIPTEQEWALRFLKKRKPSGGKYILEVKPFGSIEHLGEGEANTIQQLTFDLDIADTSTKHSPIREADAHWAPFQCFKLDAGSVHREPETLSSAQRCIICGSSLDLIAGAKSFLPEAKKRHYETPTREDAPWLCSNCAFIAYLSSVYPSSDLSIVEFPADNFLELFALYESLQGVSALVALKYVNRVASLSVLPNRYLLLSHRDGQGRMDGKTQVYLQLREQRHLLKYVERPMRVQIEGGIPQMWSEIQPHLAVGLSHFRELPPYYETRDSARKGFAYELVRALQEGLPYKALYVAVKYADDNGHPFERRVFTQSLKVYESYVSNNCQPLARSLGGETVSDGIYNDIKEFSDYLFGILHPLVRREVQKSGSSVSGIARKYTDLIQREFGAGMAGKFLYTVCQEADSAERDGDGWVKHNTFTKLYGGSPDTKGKPPEEIARAWDEFRQSHPVQLEVKLDEYCRKHGTQHALWQKFLREVQARTLALLMLNVRSKSS